MAFITTKAAVAIVGSRAIKNVNFDLYLDKNNIGQVISGGATGVDTLGESWAKRNKIESVAFLPNFDVYGFPAALFERNKDMAKAADIVVAFWDGKSHGTKHMIDYAKSIGREVQVHLIEER